VFRLFREREGERPMDEMTKKERTMRLGIYLMESREKEQYPTRLGSHGVFSLILSRPLEL